MRRRRRRIDLVEQFITDLLKKHIGGFFASLVAKAINRFAKDLAQKLFDYFKVDPNELEYEDEFELFI